MTIRASPVLYEERDTIAVVRLNRRSTGNRLDDDVTESLAEALALARDRTGLRCVVIAAAGADFSVGTRSTPAEPVDRGTREAVERLAALPLPTIAAIRGRAVGAGLEVALACDLRIVAHDARLSMPQVRHGRLPSAGGTQRLPRLVGPTRAIEMIALGSVVKGHDAVRIGLATRSVPPADVDAVAIELAAQCAAQAPIAVRYAKEAVLSGLDLPLAHAMRMELDLAILLQSTDDRWEGLAAFHERRRPTMRGT